ncbi:LexA family transcriptional regulator [Spirosoma agri]|uniref:Helix-turn-helix transcriptional regulator n=1 Tax=Spirosoma agri TaxID=1987381 RepID=A0A6M0IIZ9_9BACT|nr:XRE family transcriptional regulator [Spirosoma agri]NEU68266.1 helix-turn-helix transcriptional regulator [Spirosoma agri]
MTELLELVSDKAQRLIQVRETLGLNPKQFADKLEENPSNYYQMEAGKRPIGKHKSNELVRLLHLNPIWWETGQGEMFAPKGTVELKMVDDEEYESAWLPYYSIPLQGSFNEMSDPESNYGQAEKIKVIIKRGENVERNVVFEVRGQSMYPKYSEGTKIRCKIVNPADWEYISSGVYAISYNDSFVVKRIKDNELYTKGFLTLHSDNPDYGSTTVPTDQIHHIWKILRIIDSPAD